MNDLSRQRTGHLTNEQFSECLTAEMPDAAVEAHLAQCDECRTELGVFLSVMDDFSAASMEWSRSHPLISPRVNAGRAKQPMGVPLAWALAVALIAAVGVPVAMHYERAGDKANVVVAQADAGDSPAQIAQDNDLLRSVDVALGENDPSPMQEYGLEAPQKRGRADAQTRFE